MQHLSTNSSAFCSCIMFFLRTAHRRNLIYAIASNRSRFKCNARLSVLFARRGASRERANNSEKGRRGGGRGQISRSLLRVVAAAISASKIIAGDIDYRHDIACVMCSSFSPGDDWQLLTLETLSFEMGVPQNFQAKPWGGGGGDRGWCADLSSRCWKIVFFREK